MSNRSGSYNFDNLCPGTYKVSEEVKTGWKVVEPVNNLYSLNIFGGGAAYVDFGNIPIPTATPSANLCTVCSADINKDRVVNN